MARSIAYYMGQGQSTSAPEPSRADALYRRLSEAGMPEHRARAIAYGAEGTRRAPAQRLPKGSLAYFTTGRR